MIGINNLIIPFGTFRIYLNKADYQYRYRKREPIEIKDRVINDRYLLLIDEKHVKIGDEIRIKFEPSELVDGIDNASSEGIEGICYEVGSHLITLSVAADKGLDYNHVTIDEKRYSIIIDIVDDYKKDLLKLGFGVAWIKDTSTSFRELQKISAYVDIASEP